MNSGIKSRVLEKVSELISVANHRLNTSLELPVVFFDCVGTKGGYHRNGVLYFNPVLLAENVEHYLSQTVPHEVAHYVQKKVYPRSLESSVFHNRRVHGREWQSIMYLFGVEPSRTHNYDVTNSRRRIFKKIPLYCECTEVQTYVTLKIVNKMNAGTVYRCRRCNERVSLTKPLTPEQIPA
jgi:SprT protein